MKTGNYKCKSKNKNVLIDIINKTNKISIDTVDTVNRIDIIDTIIENNSEKNAIISDIDNNMINILDLFCGCGGMSKGLTDAGLNIIAGIDFWDKAINSYRKNFNHLAICEDLTKLPPEKFNELYNKDNKMIDLIVGGPPCQGFSIAGKEILMILVIHYLWNMLNI